MLVVDCIPSFVFTVNGWNYDRVVKEGTLPYTYLIYMSQPYSWIHIARLGLCWTMLKQL